MTVIVHILIPAAGASRRMRGEDKLLRSAGGVPLLRRVAATAVATGAPVLVTLAEGQAGRLQMLAGLDLGVLQIADAALGMSRSLAEGAANIEAASDGPKDGVMILPADMPDFTTAALSDLIHAFQANPDLILRGTSGDRPGHPVIFPRALWPELRALTGDEGARAVLMRHQERVRTLPLPGEMALTDLDSPEYWHAWEARQRQSPQS